MRRVLFLLAPALCALAAALPPLHAAGRGDEIRALWIGRATLESEDAIRRTVSEASTAGVNTLFVQAIDDGTAIPGFDPIAGIISQAHKAGIQVHAWVDVARVVSPGELPFSRTHVVYEHPEWLMVPRAIAAELLAVDVHSPDYLGRLARWTRNNTDRVDGLYVSPVQADAAAHVADVVRDLVHRYAVDGIYFDHVAYPSPDFDYGAKSIAAFRTFIRGELPPAERQRIDAAEAIDPFAYPNEAPEQWRLFRQSQLTALIARLRSTVKEVRPDAIVSAAVTPDVDIAAGSNLQDWRTWAENRFVDALCPRLGGGNASQIAAQVAQISALAAGLPVWVTDGSSPPITRAAIKTP